MKFRKLLGGGLLAAVLALGGVAGLATRSESKSASADDNATPSSYAKIYRFTKPAEYWGDTVYIHIWGSKDTSKNTNWPGINLSNEYSFNEQGRKVYTFATNVTDYTELLFHNNSGWQTDDITIGTDTAWYLDSGNTPGTWTPANQTYYLYDYTNMFGGSAKCFAKQSNGSLTNGEDPGVPMSKVEHGSGQLYTISLDPAFDILKFGIGSSANTGEQYVNYHRGQTFCWWKADDSSWSDDFDWIKAHDWIYQTMHVRDIPTTDNRDTNECRGTSGYYQRAKTAYQSFGDGVKAKIAADDCWGIAQARLTAWAIANGETASFDGTALTIGRNINAISIFESTNNSTPIMLVVIISIVSLTAVGGYIFLKRRKED